MSFNANKRLRFNADDDLALLREVTTQNPLRLPQAWFVVQENIEKTVGKRYSIRTLKDHLQLLLETWSLRRKRNQMSGIEEKYSEKDHLLQKICDLCKENSIKRKRKAAVSKEEQIINLAKKAREERIHLHIQEIKKMSLLDEKDLKESPSPIFTEETIDINNGENEETVDINTDENENNVEERNEDTGISAKTTDSNEDNITGPRKRRITRNKLLRQNTLKYLKNKNGRELQLRIKDQELEEKKLHLAERQMDLDERWLEFEIAEQRRKIDLEKTRLELEVNQQKEMFNIIQNQQKIIEALLQKID